MDNLENECETGLSSVHSIEGEIMSHKLRQAGNQLVDLLRLNFRPTGNPPVLSQFLFGVEPDSIDARQGITEQIGRFEDLFSDNKYALEALDRIPILASAVSAIDEVSALMDSDSAPKLDYLLSQLLKMNWVNSELNSSGQTSVNLAVDKNTLGILCELAIKKLEAFKLDSQGNKMYLGDGQELSGLADRINDAVGRTVVNIRRPSIPGDLSSAIIVNGPFGKTTVGYSERFGDGFVLISDPEMDQYRLRCIDFLNDWITESKLNPTYGLTFDTDGPTSQSPSEFGYELCAIDEQFLWSMKTALDEIDNSNFSKPQSPNDWEGVFGCSWRTIKRGIKSKKIRAIEISTKSYRIHLEDIPDRSSTK